MIRHVHNSVLRRLALALLLSLAPLLVLPSQATAAGLLVDTRKPGEFLPAEEAFRPLAEVLPGRIVLSWQVTPGHYLYDKQFRIGWAGDPSGLPALPSPQASLPGEWHDDPSFGRVKIYREDLALTLPAPAGTADAQSGTATLQVRYQGCADAGLCYPPQTWEVPVDLALWQADPADGDGAGTAASVPATADAPAGARTESRTAQATAPAALPADRENAGALADWLAGASLPLVLGAFLLLGLGLAFTPCVLPMLPILSAIIAGDSRADARRGFLLALSYVLGMSLMYTLAGLLIAGLGAAANLSALLQKPAVLIGFALLFALLAVLLLQGRDLRLPAFIGDRLQAAQARRRGGAYGPVFIMGAISSLIVSPCVTAPLAGVMIFLSASQDMVLGGAALFALSLGMGLPLLLLGAGGGRFLPRSGPWLDAVKRLFGWLLLAVALTLVNRLLPPAQQLLAWAGFLALTAAALLRLDASRFRHPLAVLALLLLTWAGLQVWSAARGGSDALRPWQAPAVPAGATAAGKDSYFTRIEDPAVLERAIAAARADGRPVIVDIYADWCISCVEMERNVLAKPAVRSVLDRGTRLKFDITATTPAQLDWLQQRNLFGPPVFLFWGADGRERPALIGESTESTFMRNLESAWN